MPYLGYTQMWEDDIYHKHTQVAMIEKKIAPYLFMRALVPTRGVNKPIVEQQIDGPDGTETLGIDDPLARKAGIRTPSSEFKQVKVSALSRKFYGMDMSGVEMVFSEDLKEMDSIDMINRTQERVAEWMAAQFNYEVLKRTVNAFNLTVDGNNTYAIDHASDLSLATSSGAANGIFYGTIDSDYYWDGADGNPLWDLTQLRGKMARQGNRISYPIDTVICPSSVYEYIRQDLEYHEYAWTPSPWGGRSSMTIPQFHGITFVEAFEYDGLPEEYVLCMGRNRMPAVTYFYNAETGFSKWSKDSEFWTHQYMNNQTHDLVTQIWTKRRTVLQRPTAIAVLKVTA